VPAKHSTTCSASPQRSSEHFAHAIQMFIQHVLLEIRNFMRPFCAGEVEEEGAVDHRHFNRTELLIPFPQSRHIVSSDKSNSFGTEDLVNFQLAGETIQTIEEFHRGKALGTQDKSILPRTRPEKTREATVISPFEFVNARFVHAALG